VIPLPSTPPARAAASAAHGWQWYATRAVVALFVLALLGLLWVLQRQEVEDRRTAVIRDILWIEQNARFALERDVEQLSDLGGEVDAGQERFETRAAYLLQNSPGLLRVAAVDAAGRVVRSEPAPLGDGAPLVDAASAAARELALRTGTSAYGPVTRTVQGNVFLVFVPYARGGRIAGTVVGVYGLSSMLSTLVPWWIAEKHRVTLRDTAGAVLAAKSNVEAVQAEVSHQVPLDPPGHGLILDVESYRGETQLLRNVLTAVIVILALAVVWNVWALRRHVRRRLATEEALRAEHAFRKAMEDSLHTGMRAVDLEGRIVYVNPAFCNMVGLSAEQLIGSPPPQAFWPPEEEPRISELLRAARAPGAPRAGMEMRLLRADGERFDALVFEAPLIDVEGKQRGWMASVVDITERKRARELVRQQQEKLASTARLVTVGEMASTMAHELNQPLSAISSYATGCLNLLAQGEAPRAELEEALRKTSQQAQRAGRIIRRVHDFVRKRDPTFGRVRMNAVVEDAVGFADADARRRRVRIRLALSGRDPEIVGDPVLLQQVVLNLLRNAMDAMAATPPEAREIVVTTADATDGVVVSIADRGGGIPDDVRTHLFQPFFTTKAEGMGMGLNICRSILELHRGRVWADANPGGGTVFSFSLPADVAAPVDAA
jgi:two-component system sensor histidine kinase DctS